MAKESPVCPPEELDSEDELFMLYTSGSTGKPKGIVHTQAGYLLYASLTQQVRASAVLGFISKLLQSPNQCKFIIEHESFRGLSYSVHVTQVVRDGSHTVKLVIENLAHAESFALIRTK